MSEPIRDQFAQQVIDIVRAKFPLIKIPRADQPVSMRVNGSIHSLENLFRITRLRPEHLREDVERWAIELLRVAEGMPRDEESFEQLKDRILPMLLPETSSDPDLDILVNQPLVAGLRVTYTVDSDKTFSYISRPALERWEVSLDDLHELSLQNLVARSEAINAHAANDDNGIYLILFQTMDGYDASRLLLPTLHERLREHLGSPFAAGIPNRDILLCFRNDDDTVSKLRDQIQKDFQRMPHQVTDKLLLITPDGIAPRD
jgi:hypothetical protein